MHRHGHRSKRQRENNHKRIKCFGPMAMQALQMSTVQASDLPSAPKRMAAGSADDSPEREHWGEKNRNKGNYGALEQTRRPGRRTLIILRIQTKNGIQAKNVCHIIGKRRSGAVQGRRFVGKRCSTYRRARLHEDVCTTSAAASGRMLGAIAALEDIELHCVDVEQACSSTPRSKKRRY